ncbi:class II aldolase/adducin family protein [Bradyrhizobium prioriisuperbiae]|uniref:class II aldolase/adducin family protein n=1 Tax=Bradyrhizobium prioriisuperbiae TaxID=2854389 RepID=UPI0028ECCC3F|nr:class II aldolase/adducin family protein [Bradyrhizobium prioritasuperba]
MSNFKSDEWQLRVDLAAAFRMAALLDWHEGIANHFSVALSNDGRRFLMNPKWRHFSLVKASELVLFDADDDKTMEQNNAPDPTAWHIHGSIHAKLPAARCVMHLHSPYATALSTLSDPELKAIDQTTARFHQRVALDLEYGGMADDQDEGLRLVAALGNHQTLLMGNHGVLVTGPSIAETFDTLYHFERACRTLMLAYASGRDIRFLSDHVAEKTAQAWQRTAHAGLTHFSEMKQVLDRRDSSYAT